VPPEHQAEFDDALAEARVALDLRDDNGPMTVEWPLGLLRRAVLETGHRLAERGHLHSPDHAVELSIDELKVALTDPTSGTVDPDEVADRAARRVALAAVEPPAALGEEPPPPDFSAFPSALRAVTEMAMTATELLERPAEPRSLGGAGDDGAVAAGLGVGTERCTGRARVATSAELALASIEPGDVLVVPFTTPAYNAVLAVCGAVVTAEGGPLSHAAVLARELGLPAVIGAAGALSAIPDGADVEVDPVAGVVRLAS
jgi:pyruvate,water dikinase